MFVKSILKGINIPNGLTKKMSYLLSVAVKGLESALPIIPFGMK